MVVVGVATGLGFLLFGLQLFATVGGTLVGFSV